MPLASLIVSGFLHARKSVQAKIRTAYCDEYKHQISVLETELEMAVIIINKAMTENKKLEERNKALTESLENALDALNKRAERLKGGRNTWNP